MESPSKILIVEDDFMSNRLLATVLTRLGYTVETAFDGISGLEKVESSPPDLILLDLNLPRMNGFEVARRLRATPDFDRTVLVASTGYSRDRDRARASEVGFDYYLVKPFDPRSFVRMLTSPGRSKRFRPDFHRPQTLSTAFMMTVW